MPQLTYGTINTVLDERAILPFVMDDEIGAGSFGTVHKIQIHPRHQPLSGGLSPQVGLFAVADNVNCANAQKDCQKGDEGRS